MDQGGPRVRLGSLKRNMLTTCKALAMQHGGPLEIRSTSSQQVWRLLAAKLIITTDMLYLLPFWKVWGNYFWLLGNTAHG